MAQLLKDGQVTDNTWTLVAEDAAELPAGDILVPLNLWQQQGSELDQHGGTVGVWLVGNEEIDNKIALFL
mgnify:FL=1